MRRPRRGRGTGGSRHLSLSATDAEWDAVRRNAAARGLSIARYLVGLVERGGAEEGARVSLSRDEQRELLCSVREIRALMPGRSVAEEAEPEDSGGGEAERLRREIRDWPGRAEALIADRPARDAAPADLRERRRRIEALFEEVSAMQAEDSPHAPHLEAMPVEREALRSAGVRLAASWIFNEMLEAARLDEAALAFARRSGGIAYDAPGYPALMERARSLAARPRLPEQSRERVRGLIARDARWRRDRERVAGFLDRARDAVRAGGDLADEIRALHGPAGSALPDRGPGRAEGLVAEAAALVGEVPARDLAAHLRAAGATAAELEALTERLHAMLGS